MTARCASCRLRKKLFGQQCLACLSGGSRGHRRHGDAVGMSSNWANWDAFAPKLGGFVEWAEPPPANSSEERYAIVSRPYGTAGIAWARVSPNPDVSPEYSSGRFYDDAHDHPEGAVAWARAAAKAHKRRMAMLVYGGAPRLV